MDTDKVIVEAIRDKKILKFEFEGKNRVMKPHMYGTSTANNQTNLLVIAKEYTNYV